MSILVGLFELLSDAVDLLSKRLRTVSKVTLGRSVAAYFSQFGKCDALGK